MDLNWGEIVYFDRNSNILSFLSIFNCNFSTNLFRLRLMVSTRFIFYASMLAHIFIYKCNLFTINKTNRSKINFGFVPSHARKQLTNNCDCLNVYVMYIKKVLRITILINSNCQIIWWPRAGSSFWILLPRSDHMKLWPLLESCHSPLSYSKWWIKWRLHSLSGRLPNTRFGFPPMFR